MKKKLVATALAVIMLVIAYCGVPAHGSSERYQYGNYWYMSVDGGVSLLYYVGTETQITVPSSIEGIPVVGIGFKETDRACFFANRDFESVTLPESLKYIGHSTFSGCEDLASINIPDSVTFIGRSAFSRCKSLAEVILPENLEHLGARAFDQCTSLTSITIPPNVTEFDIGYAFAGCSSLREATVLCKELGRGAFRLCESLETVRFGEGVESISVDALSGCPKLKTLVLPSNIKKLGYMPFNYSGITNIVMRNPDIEFEEGYDDTLKLDKLGPTFERCDYLKEMNAFEGTQVQSYAQRNGIGFTPIANISVNGEMLETDVPAVVIDGRTLAPVRAVFESLGASVEWDDATQTANATLAASLSQAPAAARSVAIRIDAPQMTVDGASISLDAPSRLVLDRAMAPVRAIAESLGASVEWDDATQTVNISTAG